MAQQVMTGGLLASLPQLSKDSEDELRETQGTAECLGMLH